MPDQVIRVTNGASLVVRSGAILGVGPMGPVGPAGPVGPQGIQGTYLYTTPAAPTSASSPAPRTGDLWVNPANGILSVYDATAGTWTAGTTSILGPVGPTGPQGIQGATGATGPTGSASGGFATFNALLLPADQHQPPT